MGILDGYKTYIGGGGAIAIGLGTLLYNWSVGQPSDMNMVFGWIIAGWTIIGGRSAVNKAL